MPGGGEPPVHDLDLELAFLGDFHREVGREDVAPDGEAEAGAPDTGRDARARAGEQLAAVHGDTSPRGWEPRGWEPRGWEFSGEPAEPARRAGLPDGPQRRPGEQGWLVGPDGEAEASLVGVVVRL